MGTLIRRQKLSESQYARSNRVMCFILVVSYLSYIIIEIMNAAGAMTTDVTLRCGIHTLAAIVSVIITILIPKKKAAAVIMAVTYLISFPVLVFGNGVVVLAMVFPVLIGFMIYLNSVIVGLGCISSIIIGVIKCITVIDDSVLFNYGVLIIVGYVVATVGAMSVIILLINFSQEDRAEITQAAEHRERVAKTVENIVSKLYSDFSDMVGALETINNAMRQADDAIKGIADSSDNTAAAVNSQAQMTSHIQQNIEHTDALAAQAENTTENLKEIIIKGRELADGLLSQSDIVDGNVELISDVMKRLVDNVGKVTGITGEIMNISSQTNLLALNASVEAARAGSAGKGFSVIASEIRTMSEGTEASTEKIESIINELTTLTDETQSTILEAADSISQQRKQVDAVNSSFREIQEGMLILRGNIEEMSNNVKAVLSANSEIVDSIGLLSTASQETSAGMQICKQTTNTAFENLGQFSNKVNGAFGGLEQLKETVEE